MKKIWTFACSLLLMSKSVLAEGGSDISYSCALTQACGEVLAGLPYAWDHNIEFSGTQWITADTNDASDTGLIVITGGGAPPNISRGAYLWLYGNDYGGVTRGDWYLRSGDVATDGGTGHLSARLALYFQRNQAGYQTLWTLDTANGRFYNDPTNGGNLALTKAGTTLEIQESGGGADCMGSATANGTTAVTIATTCARTGSRIQLTRSSAPSGTAQCWWDTLVSNTSFNLDCSAAETGTFNWLIINEAA